MKPANVPNISNADSECFTIATKAITARGMARAAAYIAKMNEASVGAEPVGSTDFGLTSPAIENPAATKTLIAVTSEAIRMDADLGANDVIGIVFLSVAPLMGVAALRLVSLVELNDSSFAAVS
jgi:hypothetical protein